MEEADAAPKDEATLAAVGQALAVAGSMIGAHAEAAEASERTSETRRAAQAAAEAGAVGGVGREEPHAVGGAAQAAGDSALAMRTDTQACTGGPQTELAASCDAHVQLTAGVKPDPTRVQAGTAIKMLQYRAMRRPKGAISDAPAGEGDEGGGGWKAGSGAGTGAITSTFGREYSERPWLLTKSGGGVVGYEDEEMGPVETEAQCVQRRASTCVAILGTGKMARRLARLWARGGYPVLLGSRDPVRGVPKP